MSADKFVHLVLANEVQPLITELKY